MLLQHVLCGEYFSVAGTTDNDLLFWGIRFKSPPQVQEETNGKPQPWELQQESRTRQTSTASAGSSGSQARDTSRGRQRSRESLVDASRDGDKEGGHSLNSCHAEYILGNINTYMCLHHNLDVVFTISSHFNHDLITNSQNYLDFITFSHSLVTS